MQRRQKLEKSHRRFGVTAKKKSVRTAASIFAQGLLADRLREGLCSSRRCSGCGHALWQWHSSTPLTPRRLAKSAVGLRKGSGLILLGCSAASITAVATRLGASSQGRTGLRGRSRKRHLLESTGLSEKKSSWRLTPNLGEGPSPQLAPAVDKPARSSNQSVEVLCKENELNLSAYLSSTTPHFVPLHSRHWDELALRLQAGFGLEFAGRLFI